MIDLWTLSLETHDFNQYALQVNNIPPRGHQTLTVTQQQDIINLKQTSLSFSEK